MEPDDDQIPDVPEEVELKPEPEDDDEETGLLETNGEGGEGEEGWEVDDDEAE